MIITTPGLHTLTDDVVSTGLTAIEIRADNVRLNLNGHTVRCQPSDPATAHTTAIAVHGHVAIIEGGLVTGAMFGVYNHGGRDSTFLVDLDISGNTYVGANLAYGRGCTVRRVTCKNIGGYRTEAYAIGINGIGHDGAVEHCLFGDIYRQSGVSGVGEGVAILVEDGAQNVKIDNNQIRNGTLEQNTIGVWGAVRTTGRISRNTFANIWTPIANMGAMVDAGDNTSTTNVPPPLPTPLPTDDYVRVRINGVEYEGVLQRVQT